MMNYETFKKAVAENFLGYMPENYQNMRVYVNAINKVNGLLDGLSLLDDTKSRNVCPTIYINDMYKEYQATENLQSTLKKAAEIMVKAFGEIGEVPSIDPLSVKRNVVFQLVNTIQNKDMLATVPHREFLDLSIIYRWIVKLDDSGIQSAVITDNFAKAIGVDEKQLFKAAAENTERILPPFVKPMNDILSEALVENGMPAEVVKDILADLSMNHDMYVISNERKVNGAASMLYEDRLHELAETLKTNLYILPSSVHEVIAVSTDVGDPCDLAQMVSDVNMGQVDLEERLSNQVYHYDKGLRKLTLATDSPNKRLNGESQLA